MNRSVQVMQLLVVCVTAQPRLCCPPAMVAGREALACLPIAQGIDLFILYVLPDIVLLDLTAYVLRHSWLHLNN
jgi:hypothetical protein